MAKRRTLDSVNEEFERALINRCNGFYFHGKDFSLRIDYLRSKLWEVSFNRVCFPIEKAQVAKTYSPENELGLIIELHNGQRIVLVPWR